MADEKHDELVGYLKLLVEMNERLIVSIEAMTRPQEEHKEQEPLWRVEIWSLDRGVKIGAYESDSVPEPGQMMTIAGFIHEITDVARNSDNMRVKVKVKATGELE